MRTLYTLILTLIFIFSLFAVYNVGYERGKNKAFWNTFHEISERDSVLAFKYRFQSMAMYKYGYTQGVINHQVYGSSAFQLFKNDSIKARKIIQ